jgi:hypothetical protein
MGRTINTADLYNVVLQRRKEYGKFADVIEDAIEEMVAATPTTDRTNQDFIDRCRECGKTAITRAENDEILNEAWHLMQNATEEDGVTTEEANGMIKLLALFLHKYHNQKKPEWAENVEARLANPKPEKYKMHPIKDGFPKSNSWRYLVQASNGDVWTAEYDENQENPAERFGEWLPIFIGGRLKDTEWTPYPEIVAWCELPKLVLYEEEEEKDDANIRKELKRAYEEAGEHFNGI